MTTDPPLWLCLAVGAAVWCTPFAIGLRLRHDRNWTHERRRLFLGDD